jgi:hypothetical protein
VSGVEGGAPLDLGPDPTALERVRSNVDARARDAEYAGEVHRAVMAEVDPVLAVRVDAIDERAQAEHRRMWGERPRLTTPKWEQRLGHALLALILVPVGVIVSVHRYEMDAPPWLVPASWVALAVIVAALLVMDRVEKRRAARLQADLSLLARTDRQMEVAERRTERELETLFARVPPARATLARAMELALLREGYESGRVSERQVRETLPVIAWHWPTAR